MFISEIYIEGPLPTQSCSLHVIIGPNLLHLWLYLRAVLGLGQVARLPWTPPVLSVIPSLCLNVVDELDLIAVDECVLPLRWNSLLRLVQVF